MLKGRHLLVLVAAAVVAGAVASTASATTWYWSPGYCKSQLKHAGVQYADGRTFYAAQSFCIGVGGTTTCEWYQGERQYTRFLAVARSNDGAVRKFSLKTTGKKSWTSPGATLLEKSVTAEDFIRTYGAAASQLAASEQKKGCAGG
jgi:hypothetical protein